MGRISAAGLALVLSLVLVGCFGPDPKLTESGKSRPDISIEAPPSAAPGDEVEVTLAISNPGPQNLSGTVVTFARLGDPELPYPIVESIEGQSAGVVAVDPKPVAESPDGVTFRFPGLADGESLEVTFTLRIPERAEMTGDSESVGNSVQVYDAEDPERARGVPLKVRLEG
ncbi:MAG: hypothetical protein QOK47_1125 [Actinomycetota bacterium]|nr:hypothetical protein [Actinomycetota bacterium]